MPLSDSVSPNGETVSDTLPLQDSVDNNNQQIADTADMADSPALGSTARDELTLDDRAQPGSAAVDVVALSDSPSVQTTIFYAVAASDIVAISDGPSPFSSVTDALPIRDSLLIGSTEFFEVLASDIVVIGEEASLFSSIVDLVSLSDSAAIQSNLFFAVVASDIVSIIDEAAGFSSVIDVVEIVDAASMPIASVTDIVDIVVSTSLVTAKSIVEQLAVGDSFFDIAAAFSRVFSEILVLPDCIFTNESGLCNTVGIGTIVIGDAVQLMLGSLNNPAEQISVQDQLARNTTGGRDPADSMQVRDSEAMSAASPAPVPPAAIAAMPRITMAETTTMGEIGLADPAAAVGVGGTWDVSGFDNENLESLLVATGMPIYNVSTMAGSGGIEEMTMVLPAFLLSVEVDGEPSNDGVFITPTVSDLPAGMQVMVPIDAGESMDGDLGPLGNMTVSFTPAASASDATMMIAMLDNNPEQDMTSERPDGEPAFYLDVSFAGNFTGTTPSDEAFFEQAPRITFTITEEWAIENEVRLSGINLFLLDEATGEWIEISGGLSGAAVDGVYTYTATLPHLSTYVVTADRVHGGTDAREYAVSLSESLFITSAAGQGGPAGSEGRAVVKDLAESLSIVEVRPETLHQRVITVQNVTVAVNVLDVRSSGLFGAAVAALNFEVMNAGDGVEEIVITYWYSSGGTRYEDRQTVTINGGESVVEVIEIPFDSAGVYSVMIETMSKDQTLAATDIVVEVPWLAANLYMLVAIAVVAASVGAVIYVMRGGRFR